MSGRENERRAARYNRLKAAESEVGRRIGLAVDRLGVALSSGGGNPAQFLHAVHYIERGYADDSRTVPPEAPDFHVTHTQAEQIALSLHHLIQLANNAKTTFGDAE